MLNQDQLREKIRRETADRLYESLLREGEVHLFETSESTKNNPSAGYQAFKELVARHLEVSIDEVGIVGSAKVGLSLSPEKLFRQFNDGSDVDLIVVSTRHFRSLWQAFLEEHYSFAGLKDADLIRSCIFRKYIWVRDIRSSVPTLRRWNISVKAAKAEIERKLTIYNAVKYRVYESWDAVKMYHRHSFEQLKMKLRGHQS